MSVLKDVQTQNILVGKNMLYRVSIKGNDFDLPYKKIGNNIIAFLDISGQFKLIELCADVLVEQLIEKNIQFDSIVNPVSKSNAVAHAIAVRWAKRHDFSATVVARKNLGSTGTENAKSVSYTSVTTQAVQNLSLTAGDSDFIKGKKVLLVDDVFASGGTFGALQELVLASGAEVAAKAVIAVE